MDIYWVKKGLEIRFQVWLASMEEFVHFGWPFVPLDMVMCLILLGCCGKLLGRQPTSVLLAYDMMVHSDSWEKIVRGHL